MYDYFKSLPNDRTFYQEHIRERLPIQIVDAHAHFNLPEHVKKITKEQIAADWALECGLLMSYEDAKTYTSTLLPDQSIRFVCLPWPLKDADTVANNQYIDSIVTQHGELGLFTNRPEYTAEYIEGAYLSGHYSGFKPYPYMASSVKGADISIFDFMPREQFALADRLHAAVLLHLPRKGRLPAEGNIQEIREIVNHYPNVKLVVAHFGRCFNHEYFQEALDLLGDDIHRVYFDTAAVINPKVYRMALDHLDYRRILFGTDMPIMLWHGKREWTDRSYVNLCRENFSWSPHKYPEEEANYTFIIYEQLNNLLDALDGDEAMKQAIFHDNALNVYQARR
ncbi:MAG: amidohydrolase family protein [Eubacteriales bacterium]|nr:amidohydrolase family protein [Eubacteriales bacterium]